MNNISQVMGMSEIDTLFNTDPTENILRTLSLLPMTTSSCMVPMNQAICNEVVLVVRKFRSHVFGLLLS